MLQLAPLKEPCAWIGLHTNSVVFLFLSGFQY